MDKQELREQLEQLHAELAQVKTLDSTEAEMLQHLAEDIREVLEREENQPRINADQKKSQRAPLGRSIIHNVR